MDGTSPLQNGIAMATIGRMGIIDLDQEINAKRHFEQNLKLYPF